MKWENTWKNRRWVNENGYIIDRYWDNIGDGKSFYFCFMNRVDHDKGINFATCDTLEIAKLAFLEDG